MKKAIIYLSMFLVMGLIFYGCAPKVKFDDAAATIQIDAAKVVSDVGPLMYGLMTEEINYSYDGGLYAELIRNRTFQSPAPVARGFQRPRLQPAAPHDVQSQQHVKPVSGQQVLPAIPDRVPRGNPQQEQRPQFPPQQLNPSAVITDTAVKYVKGLYYWNLIAEGDAKVSIAQDSIPQEGTALTKCLRLDVTAVNNSNRAGFSNEGYWGIPVKPNTRYKASFYAKSAPGFNSPVYVTIESNDRKTIYANGTVESISGEWKKYTLSLNTADLKATSDACLSITTKSPGTIWFSLVSLFPPSYKDRPNGNRADMMTLMSQMKPAFLRFPGGNYLEGNSPDTRFNWEKMIGPVEARPTHYNASWGYHSDDGMGLLEFMYWCEDLGMEPVVVVFAGLYLGGKYEPVTGEPLQVLIKEALEEVEYLTGRPDTEWGAKRIADGRREPFKLKYIEIGNEDWFDVMSYNNRYTAFYKAFKEKYPGLILIASATTVKSVIPDMVDLHQYMNVRNCLAEAHRYDEYDRKMPPVIIGEYATREVSPTSNFYGGICDAAYLTGLERNADVIKMTCYAPKFVNVNPGGMQWTSDLMGYNGLNCYGSPSFYVQAMFSKNIGNKLVSSSITNVPIGKENGFEEIFYSVTKESTTGKLYLKVVNVSGEPKLLQVAIDGMKKIASTANITRLSAAKLTETNSIDKPEKIIPVFFVEKGFGNKFVYNLPAYSVNVFELKGE
ncbi:MAG: alpha-L-arabinofuranosidase C-terminal domain-containing protein [Bacteroidales bacterium]